MSFRRLFFSVVILCAISASAQTVVHVAKPCSAEETKRLVPAKVLKALNDALAAGDYEQAIAIAQKPRSGLKVYSSRGPNGELAHYMIHPAKDPACYIAFMDHEE
jgi:hypothetical protein